MQKLDVSQTLVLKTEGPLASQYQRCVILVLHRRGKFSGQQLTGMYKTTGSVPPVERTVTTIRLLYLQRRDTRPVHTKTTCVRQQLLK